MRLHNIFLRLGLIRHSDTVYEYLLAHKKPVLLAHIAKNTGVARPQVYRVMKHLLSKNFVEKIYIRKRTYYATTHPKAIFREFENVGITASAKIKKLTQNYEKEIPTNVFFLSGPDGIRKAFDDVIERTPRGETFFRYTSEKDLTIVNSYLSPRYRILRDKKKLERLVISNPVSGKQKRPRLERFIKYIPPNVDLFMQNIIQLIYSDRVAFINLNTEQVIIIEDNSVAEFQKIIFKQLYKKL